MNSDIQSNRDEAWQTLMAAGALDLTKEIGSRYRTAVPAPLQDFLKKAMGCMVQALSWIHGAGIAHNDLKPANVLLRNGHLYVTDFGLCKDRSKETRTYMELAQGGTWGFEPCEIRESLENYPMRADVYSLGCVFMHMVTVIFFRQPLQTCKAILEGDFHVRESRIDEYFHQRDDYSRPGREGNWQATGGHQRPHIFHAKG